MYDPIPEIFEAARNLELGVLAHLEGRGDEASAHFIAADDPAVRQYNDRAMGSGWRGRYQFQTVTHPLPHLAKVNRPVPRMPDRETRLALLARDRLHCRYCGVPLVYAEARKIACRLYPEAVRWGTAEDDHAGFKALWLQFDHIVPNARGGESTMHNMVLACAPCNYGRMNFTLEEAGLADPRDLAPFELWAGSTTWNGLVGLLG